MKDKWINKFQTKLDGFQMSEPEGLWEDIEKVLDEKPISISAGKRASTIPLWIRIAAPVAAAAVLLLLVMIQMQYSEKCDDFNRLAVVKEDEPTAEMSHPSSGVACKMAEVERAPHTAETLVAEVFEAEEPIAEEHKEDETRPAEKAEEDSPLPQLKSAKNYVRQENKGRSSFVAKAHKPSGLSMELFACNVSLGSDRVGDRRDNMMIASDPLFGGESTLFGEFVQLKNQKPKIEMEHRQPVRYGVSFSYGITDRLSLGSGLVYSRHSSSVYSVMVTRTHVGEQHLHYLGIPLTLDYNLWNYRNFSVYGSAGMMVEKCVSGESVDAISNESTTIKEKAFQFSVNGAVGVQYSLSRHVGIYVEPGVNYYIDNGSGVNTIYKDKPLNFNLEIGLRFTFR